jgi:Tol biopolymer transport system component
MHILRWLSLPTMALLAGTAAAQTARSSPRSRLTIDQLIQIKHPSGPHWTPDGSHIWFTYDDGGVNNVWAVAADGSRPPVALTNYPESQNGDGGFWSRDGRTFFFQRGGGLLAVSVKGGTPHSAWPSATNARGFSLSPDGARVAFLVGRGRGANGKGAAGRREGSDATTGLPSPDGVDLIVHTIATNMDQKVAHADMNIGAMSWSPDGAKLAFTSLVADGISDLIVANVRASTQTVVQHGDSVTGALSWTPDSRSLVYSVGVGAAGPVQHLASPPEIGAKLIFVATEYRRGVGGRTFIVSASGGTPRQLTGERDGRGGDNWIDATHVLSRRTSNDGLTRTAESVNINGGLPTLLHVDTAAKFFSAVNTTVDALSPDRRWLLYTSDVTGWDQI